MANTIHSFQATIDIIGINPYVFVPEEILNDLFEQAGKDRGHIPVKGKVNDRDYRQTLVRYQNAWRLYINTQMLKNSPKRIGETIQVSITFDASDRSIPPHPKLVEALHQHPDAKVVFDHLSKSKKHEIVRYISQLKTAESIDRNINRAIDFLQGNGRFVGRDKP